MYALVGKGMQLFPKENKQTASSTPIVSAIGVDEVSLPTFFSKKVGDYTFSGAFMQMREKADLRT